MFFQPVIEVVWLEGIAFISQEYSKAALQYFFGKSYRRGSVLGFCNIVRGKRKGKIYRKKL